MPTTAILKKSADTQASLLYENTSSHPILKKSFLLKQGSVFSVKYNAFVADRENRMKHFNLLAIGILSLLLVGCSYNANEATSAVSSQMASDDIVTPSTAEHKLSLCVPSSEQGMYTVDSIANGYGNIFYIDFETMQQIPLCDTPNCTHSNDSCTAWLQIDESGFLPGILQLGNSILLVQNGESSNHPACIWIADANGENKKLLFSAQSGQSIGPAFYTDETNSSLYFVLSEVSESSGGITEKKCSFL